MQYLERLPDVQDAVASALMTLGDGNWRMGEGVQVGQKAPKIADIDERTILEHYTCKPPLYSRAFTCGRRAQVPQNVHRRDP